jgi:hypothetical protein
MFKKKKKIVEKMFYTSNGSMCRSLRKNITIYMYPTIFGGKKRERNNENNLYDHRTSS